LVVRYQDIIEYYFAIVIIFTGWIIFYQPPLPLIYILFYIPSTIIIYSKLYSLKKINIIPYFLFLLVIMRYSLPSVINLTDISFYAYILRSFMISSLLLIDHKYIYSIYKKFKEILVYIIALSLLFYLPYILNFIDYSPITTFIGADGEGRIWNVYYFFSLQVHPIYGEIDRFPSIFDEPGYLGTLLALLLCIEKYNLKNRKNLILFISGILTISLSFYMLSAVYFVLNYIKIIKLNYKYIPILIIIILITMNAFSETLESRIIARVIDEGNIELATDHRIGIERQQYIFNTLLSQNKINLLFGNGRDGFIQKDIDLGANWSRLVHQVGLVFFLLFILTVVMFSIKKYENLIFAIIFLLSILQRPAIFSGPIWMFLLIVGIFINSHNIVKYDIIALFNRFNSFVRLKFSNSEEK